MSYPHPPLSPAARIKRLHRDNERQWGRTGSAPPRGSPSRTASVPAPQEESSNNFTGAIGIQPVIVYTRPGNVIDIGNDGIGTSRVVVFKSDPGHTVDTINGHVLAGQLLFIHGAADEVILRHGTGNIVTASQSHVVAHQGDIIMLMFLSTDSKWHQINTTPEQAAGIAADGVSSEQLRYRLQYRGNVSGHQSPNVNVPSGYRGYYWDVTGDFSFTLLQTELIDQAAEFVICIRQDSAGGRSLTDIGASVVNATAAEVDSLVNKAPGSETAFRFVTFGNYDWHVESISIGSVTGGGGDLGFADLVGHIDPVNQIQDDSIPGSKIQDIGADQLTGADAVGCVPISGGIIVEGGTSTPVDSMWGTLPDIKGALTPDRINGGTDGQVIKSDGSDGEWATLNTGDLGDVAPVSPTVPNVLVYDTVSGQTQWRPALISDRYVDSIGIGKITWAGTSAGINHLAQLNPDGTISAGTISTVAGELDPSRISGGAAGEFLRHGTSGPEWDGASLGDLDDVEPSTPLDGQILRRASGAWGPGKITDDYINDKAIGVDKLASVSSQAGHILVSGGANANYWGTISNVSGGVNLESVNIPVAAAEGDIIRVGRDGSSLEWDTGPFRISDIDDFENVSATPGHVMVRKQVGSQVLWGPDRIDVGHVAAKPGSGGRVIGYNPSGGAGEAALLDLSTIAGKIGTGDINATGISDGRVITASRGTAVWRDPSYTVSIPRLDGVGDVEEYTADDYGKMLIYTRVTGPGGETGEWHAVDRLPGDIAVQARSIENRIDAEHLPQAIDDAFTGYDSSNGTIEARLDSLESGGSGGGTVDDLGDIGDVNAAGAENNDVLIFNGSSWFAAKIGGGNISDGQITSGKLGNGAVEAAKIANGAVSNSKISSVAASKITGTIGYTSLPSVIGSALTGYQQGEGTIEARLDSLESAAIPDIISASSTQLNVAGSIYASKSMFANGFNLSSKTRLYEASTASSTAVVALSAANAVNTVISLLRRAGFAT